MKTVTLYTEEEFKERWPLYESKSTRVQKNFDRHGADMFVRPGWDVVGTLRFDVEERINTVEFLRQKIVDMTGAIAHIEAHPEEE